jgi:hypothetical protein
MSGTSGSFRPKAQSGVSLPAPIVRLVKNPSTSFLISEGSPQADVTGSNTPQNLAQVTVYGIPQSIMEDLSTNKLQLELMRYIGTRSGTLNPVYASGSQRSGWVHPAHGPTVNAGSHTHGGAHNIGPSINALRETEWPVTNWGQKVDVTQGALGFMQNQFVQYRDPTGANNSLQLMVPSGSSGKNTMMGTRYPYEGRFRPSYFSFRWSIIDPSDSRGQRIWGPTSEVLYLSNNIFPFVPDVAVPYPNNPAVMAATATVRPNFDLKSSRFWVGSVSRLPR